jgi:sugar phosphate isomerase/epimerase
MNRSTIPRRTLLKNISLAALGSTALPGFAQEATSAKPGLILGLDAHAVRGMKWTAIPLIEYAAELKLDAVLLNGFHYFDRLDEAHLKQIRALADSKGIQIRIGAGGISQGASSFKPTYGGPEDAMIEGIRVALALGSPTVNCRIGSIQDRYTPGGIQARIAEAVTTLKAIKTRAQDAGIKFAFENHAGDTRSEEVLELIEAAGTDWCGVMLDPGNAVWAMEDPMEQLQKLGPHVLCTSVRDYTVWTSEDGAMFQWTAIGEGQMDVPAYTQRFKELCPGIPFFVETISNEARPIPFLTEGFMAGFPNLKVTDISSFLKLSRQGSPPPILKAPAGTDAKAFDQQLQKTELEKSIATLRNHN